MVTIITVTYNAATYLEETILSIINQSYQDIQYIIIDGGSTDKTLQLIRKYESKIDLWISEPDLGIFDAMNKGVKLAKGTWINFMNAGDTFCSNDTVKDVVSNKPKGIDILCGDNYLVNDKKQKTYSQAPGFINVWNSVIPCNHQSMFVKKTLLLESPFDCHYDLAADYEFIIKQYVKGTKFHFYNFPICNFLTNGQSQENSAKLQIESLMIMAKYSPNLSHNLSTNVHLTRLSVLLKDDSKNETFKYHFETIYQKINQLVQTENKIVIYGTSVLGLSIAKMFRDNILCFIDRGLNHPDTEGIPIIKPEDLKEEYNKVLISLIGREEEISHYLITEIGIPPSKIAMLNLY